MTIPFTRTEFPSSYDQLPEFLIHAALAYRAAVGSKTFAERSETDRQPFCLYSAGQVAQENNGTTRMFICRFGIPLDPNGAAGAIALPEQAIVMANVSDLPAIYRATS